MLIGDYSGQMQVYDESLSLVNSSKAHTDIIFRTKQSKFKNGFVATGSADFTVKIWNPYSNWNLIRTYTNHSSWVYSLEFFDEDTVIRAGLWDHIHL